MDSGNLESQIATEASDDAFSSSDLALMGTIEKEIVDIHKTQYLKPHQRVSAVLQKELGELD